MCVCVYIYIYIYIYTHTYIYIYKSYDRAGAACSHMSQSSEYLQPHIKKDVFYSFLRLIGWNWETTIG